MISHAFFLFIKYKNSKYNAKRLLVVDEMIHYSWWQCKYSSFNFKFWHSEDLPLFHWHQDLIGCSCQSSMNNLEWTSAEALISQSTLFCNLNLNQNSDSEDIIEFEKSFQNALFSIRTYFGIFECGVQIDGCFELFNAVWHEHVFYIHMPAYSWSNNSPQIIIEQMKTAVALALYFHISIDATQLKWLASVVEFR